MGQDKTLDTILNIIPPGLSWTPLHLVPTIFIKIHWGHCHRCISTPSLYLTRHSTGSQCSWWSTGVMCSRLETPAMRHAAEFWTCWSSRIVGLHLRAHRYRSQAGWVWPQTPVTGWLHDQLCFSTQYLTTWKSATSVSPYHICPIAFWSLSALEHLNKARITSGISDVCLECEVASHSAEHLFNCQSHLTQLTVQDLWDNPATVADFLNLDNWWQGKRCWAIITTNCVSDLVKLA